MGKLSARDFEEMSGRLRARALLADEAARRRRVRLPRRHRARAPGAAGRPERVRLPCLARVPSRENEPPIRATRPKTHSQPARVRPAERSTTRTRRSASDAGGELLMRDGGYGGNGDVHKRRNGVNGGRTEKSDARRATLRCSRAGRRPASEWTTEAEPRTRFCCLSRSWFRLGRPLDRAARGASRSSCPSSVP